MAIRHFLLAGCLGICLIIAIPSFAGNLDAPSAPAATSGFTLEDIYNRLASGIAGTPSTFTEPSAGPGSTGHTIDEIMSVAPEADNTNGALASDVVAGKTFWGLNEASGQWGLQTGTMPPAPLPRTGQTASSASGDDGDLQKGQPIPSPRFTDNGDGTVTDNLTGLVWLKKSDCSGQLDWTNGLSFCNSLANGYTCGTFTLSDGSAAGDWRMPNLHELQSLINYAYHQPAISNAAGSAKWTNDNPFLDIGIFDSYWTSTTYANDAANAWRISIQNGEVRNAPKSTTYYVWPVRDP